MGGMGVIAALLAVHRHRAGYGTDPADVGKLQKVCGGFAVEGLRKGCGWGLCVGGGGGRKGYG